MKKLVSVTLLLIFCFAIVGCKESGSLPDGMDPVIAEAKAKELVEAMNADDFDGMVALYTGGENIGIPAPTAEEWKEKIQSVRDQFKLGNFVEYTTTRFETMEDSTFGEYGLVILGCKYEKKSVAWKVSFDKDMNCVGLRI